MKSTLKSSRNLWKSKEAPKICQRLLTSVSEKKIIPAQKRRECITFQTKETLSSLDADNEIRKGWEANIK